MEWMAFAICTKTELVIILHTLRRLFRMQTAIFHSTQSTIASHTPQSPAMQSFRMHLCFIHYIKQSQRQNIWLISLGGIWYERYTKEEWIFCLFETDYAKTN